YADYFKAEKSYGKVSGKYNSGLFMVMQCTVDGWKVLDKPKCVKRCSGCSNVTKLDPTGNGEWDVRICVDNLRYTKSASAHFAAHAQYSCTTTRRYLHEADITVSCNSTDGTPSSTANHRDGTDYSRWCSKKIAVCWNWGCSTTTRFSGEGVSNTCSHQWQQSGSNSLEDAFMCLPPSSTAKEYDGSGNKSWNRVGSGKFGPDKVSEIHYEFKRY
ncbi:MAG: hypothetical protein IJ853_03440, partial [Rickettsiales bacterium]|nr:hypothetical protein [Rickettsiales bacterium]